MIQLQANNCLKWDEHLQYAQNASQGYFSRVSAHITARRAHEINVTPCTLVHDGYGLDVQ